MPKTWWLEVAFALQDYIDYYLLHKQKIIRESHTGDHVVFNARPVGYRNFLFEFDISPGETRQIYLRFKSHDGLHEPCPIILWNLHYRLLFLADFLLWLFVSILLAEFSQLE